MKPTTIALVACAVGILGTWSSGKPLTQKQIAGSIIVLIFISIMADTVPKVASPFAWILLATTLGNYGDNLFNRLGQLMGYGDTSASNPRVTGPVKDNGTPMFGGGAGGRPAAAQ